MEQTLAGAQMCLAQSWRRLGYSALSLMAALSVEGTFKNAKLDDRIAAIGHVVHTQAELEGPSKGADILTLAKKSGQTLEA